MGEPCIFLNKLLSSGFEASHRSCAACRTALRCALPNTDSFDSGPPIAEPWKGDAPAPDRVTPKGCGTNTHYPKHGGIRFLHKNWSEGCRPSRLSWDPSCQPRAFFLCRCFGVHVPRLGTVGFVLVTLDYLDRTS
ncbi:uncharacterized protein [Physcomitrium patens]|uniref:uncharacterized protein n=1 Tax=Physcomitrium patens TaxID=3218 RepID=UPI003CCCD386